MRINDKEVKISWNKYLGIIIKPKPEITRTNKMKRILEELNKK